MKLPLLLFLATAVLAQETPKLPAPTAPIISEISANKSVVVIDAKARAQDYVQAFDILRKDKPSLKIMVRTANGAIQNITELSAAPSGTLLLIKVLSNQGARIQIVPVEEIVEVNYSP